MKNTIMGVVAGAILTLAPLNVALAETAGVNANESVAKTWVPATASEQVAARGGSWYYNTFPLPAPVSNVQIPSAVVFVACFVKTTTNRNFGLNLYCRNQET